MNIRESNTRPDARAAENLVDQAIAAVRSQAIPDAAAIDSAAARAWARVSAAQDIGAAGTVAVPSAAAAEPRDGRDGRIRGCADVQALLPSYLAGSLAPGRALLVEDHTRECIPCRKALIALRTPAAAVAAPVRRRVADGRAAMLRSAALKAAGLVGVLALGGFLWQNLAPGGAAARVASVDGALFRVAAGGAALAPLAGNDEIATGDVLRTGRGAGAVLTLADGSRVEMRERSELVLSNRRDGATVQLVRGDVIVEAAKQGARRHLGVTTDDCVVSVVGTVFTVASGTKGSRVGVLEGEVRVARGRETSTLRPGDQIATHASLRQVTLADEVAWSRDAERHLERVRALHGLGRDLGTALDKAVAQANLRSSTSLLDQMPADTLVYVALPNLADTLGEAQEILRQRLAENPALQAWWQENVVASGGDQKLTEGIEHLRRLGSHLGAEIAVALPHGDAPHANGHDPRDPLLLAEVTSPQAFAEVLREEVARINQEAQEPGEAGGDAHLRVIADPSREPAAAEDAHQLLLWLDGDLLAASPDAARLRALQATRRAGSNGFVGSAFHSRLAAVYGEGAGWLLGVDLERAVRHAMFGSAPADPAADADQVAERQRHEAALAASGMTDARFAIVERKESGGLTETRLALSFSGARRGLASWLAEPGPMGSLDFVSPEANLYAGFLAKSPAGMVDDLFAILTASDPQALERLAEVEAREGFDLRADLAAPLGGEIAFAIDGPYLPTPSWKLILEVYDSARLQAAIERMAEHLRDQPAANAANPVDGAAAGEWTVTREREGSRDFYRLAAGAMEIHYLYEGSYLLAAPSRALLLRAVQYRETGYSLAGAERFTSLLPHDREDNFSAVVFQDLGGALGPLAGLLGGQANLAPEQQDALQQMAADAPATLLYAYGEEDQILAGTRGSGPWASSLGSLLGIAGTLKGLHDEPAEEMSPESEAGAAADTAKRAVGAHDHTHTRSAARDALRSLRGAA